MCVLSGDPLDDYGPVLWCCAALWSQVKPQPSSRRMSTQPHCLFIDLMLPVLGAAVLLPPLYSYAFMYPVTPASRFILPVAH